MSNFASASLSNPTMAKIVRTLSKKMNQQNEAEILLRVTVSRTTQIRVKSGLCIRPARFNAGRISYPKANQKEVAKLRALEVALEEIEKAIIDYCYAHHGEHVTAQDLYELVRRTHISEEDGNVKQVSFFELWDNFLNARDLSERRKAMYRSLGRALHRYEVYRGQCSETPFVLSVESFSAEDFANFSNFYKREPDLYETYPEIYLRYPTEVSISHKTHKPQPRGENSVVLAMKRIRAFFNWCNVQGITQNRPFDRYSGSKTERYGTPVYLTAEERDQLAAHDFSTRPKLAVQRDIFIFQCYIGCRVSDLARLTASNIVGDFVEYIPNKTKKERQDVVRVPLHATAKAIIERYKDSSGGKLLPFISDQRYNEAIKEMCKLAGLDRVVTVVNPTTGQDEQKPIWQVASSHMARRTFIGNLYKKVKDPNLIGSMSGHAEGSRAFARYREIDDDIKQEVINLLGK